MDDIELEKVAHLTSFSRLHVAYSINLVAASTQQAKNQAKNQDKAPSHHVYSFAYYAAALPWALQVIREILFGDYPIQFSCLVCDCG